MNGLPGYDEWKTTPPEVLAHEVCAVCEDRLDDEGGHIVLEPGEAYACSAKCEAAWHLRQADTVGEQLEAAWRAGNEDVDYDLRVELYSGAVLTGQLQSRATRDRRYTEYEMEAEHLPANDTLVFSAPMVASVEVRASA